MTCSPAPRNHQIRLARRPVGLPVRADWSFTAEPVATPEPGGVLVKTLAALARPGDARLDERGQELHRAGRHRRGDARRRHRRRRRLEDRRRSRSATTSAARSACRSTRASTRARSRAASLVRIDLARRHADAVAQRARHARHDRLLRPARRRPAASPARRSSSRARPARSARPSASSRRSRAAAPSASPAARRSATGWSRSSASTPASTTRPARSRTA